MDLYEQLAMIVQELDAEGIPYALYGALALAVHGVPRATSDIDLIVPLDDAEVGHDRGVADPSAGVGSRAAHGPSRALTAWRGRGRGPPRGHSVMSGPGSPAVVPPHTPNSWKPRLVTS